MELTGYEPKKCEEIIAFFGNNYIQAESQYKKFIHKRRVSIFH